MYYDPDKTAGLIRGFLAIKKIKQGELARKVGVSQTFLSHFLCRRIDLLPKHIDAIISELGLEEQIKKLTRLNND